MRSKQRNTHPIRFKLSGALLCAALATPLLGGCFFGAVAGITAGSLAAADRRTVGIQVEDRSIQLKATSAIRERVGEAANINVTVYNRQVLLTGQAPDAETRNRADAAAAGVANVRLLVNDIQIAGNTSFSTRSNDALLTTKVKATFVDAQDVYANAFKVTTENGVVYLVGLVTDREGNRAADLASTISGVVKVVKVLDIISEDELAKMKMTPSNGVENQIGTPSQSK